MDKGDIVLVHATVEAGYNLPYPAEAIRVPLGGYSTKRCLYRTEEKEPWKGIVCGWTVLRTGFLNAGSYDDPGYLWKIADHRVWVVEPIRGDRWFNPERCLEDDLEVLDGR